MPAGQWHTVKALESGSVILEMKDGPYEPQSDEDILRLLFKVHGSRFKKFKVQGVGAKASAFCRFYRNPGHRPHGAPDNPLPGARKVVILH